MPSSESNSVTGWIADLRQGQGQAACEIWKRFSARVTRIARRELEVIPRRGMDEEDVALSVFNTVFQGFSLGRYSYLKDRTQLWALLVKITRTKANGLKRHELRLKRGGKLRVKALNDEVACLENGPKKPRFVEPTAAEAIELADELHHLMGLLRADDLRIVAKLTLEGYSTREIALELDVVDRSVRRKLAIIRTTWENAIVRMEKGVR
jgi:DNA-directed RNA polymerase specialized sigma24 family protein